MIEVFIERRNGFISGITASGHAQSSHYGRDLVCAAVSVLMTTGVNALESVAGIDSDLLSIDIDEDSGFLSVKVDDSVEFEKKVVADTVFRTIEVGLKDVAAEYSKYVTLKYGRCNND